MAKNHTSQCLWGPCSYALQGLACHYAGTKPERAASQAHVAASGKCAGKPICGPCSGKRGYDVARINLMAATDLVTQRQALGEKGEILKASEGEHKLAFAKSVKGSRVTRAKVLEAAGVTITTVAPAKLASASVLADVETAKLEAPAKPKRQRKRPAAKTA